MEPSRTQLYRDRVNAKWLGVCAGLADYFQIDPIFVRAGFLFGTIMSGGLTIILYVIMAMLTSAKPAALYQTTPEEARFWGEVRVAPQRSIREVHSRFRDIDRRLRDIEAHVVGSNSRLAAEIEQLR